MSTSRHERDDHTATRTRPRPSAEVDAQHPILELQQQAGNAAVAGLLGVQRHSLSPEEEAGE